MFSSLEISLSCFMFDRTEKDHLRKCNVEHSVEVTRSERLSFSVSLATKGLLAIEESEAVN